jgi:hypothetical protein
MSGIRQLPVVVVDCSRGRTRSSVTVLYLADDRAQGGSGNRAAAVRDAAAAESSDIAMRPGRIRVLGGCSPAVDRFDSRGPSWGQSLVKWQTNRQRLD